MVDGLACWYPVSMRETEVLFPGGAGRLAGTLAFPATSPPHPGVLLVTGSGSHERDQLVAGHPTFLVLSRKLVARGFAVLRVDDRGTGASTGDAASTSFDAAVADARAKGWGSS